MKANGSEISPVYILLAVLSGALLLRWISGEVVSECFFAQ